MPGSMTMTNTYTAPEHPNLDMTRMTMSPQERQSIVGHNHLELSSTPGFGLVVLVRSKSSGEVHLVGVLVHDKTCSELLKLDKCQIHDKLCDPDIRTPGIVHKDLEFDPHVPDGKVIGGGVAFWDGQTLFLGDKSGDFGAMSTETLNACLVNSKIEFSFREELERGDPERHEDRIKQQTRHQEKLKKHLLDLALAKASF